MQYDLFISYSRKDNISCRVSELKERIEADYLAFANEEEYVPLHPQLALYYTISLSYWLVPSEHSKYEWYYWFCQSTDRT